MSASGTPSRKAGARFGLVLFDLDGVLIDSRRNMEAAWSHVCSKFGLDIPFDHYFAEIGLPFSQIMDNIGAPGDRKALAAAYSAGSVANFGLIEVYPGVPELLDGVAAAGIRTGIVTSKDAERTRRAVDLIGRNFQAIRSPEAGLAGKPAPDQLLAAAADAGTAPTETVYVGDMAVDCTAALRAGMAYVHARWGYGKAPANCPVEAESPALLLEYLAG